VPGEIFRDAKLLGLSTRWLPTCIATHTEPARRGREGEGPHQFPRFRAGRGPEDPATAITDAEFEKVLQAQNSSRARAAQMQHAARYHIIGFSSQNPAYARKMSEKLEEILQRFKDDWDALERELRKFIEELRQGDRNEFPGLDPTVHRAVRPAGSGRMRKGAPVVNCQRTAAIAASLEMVERIRQEVRKVGFWKTPRCASC